MKWHLHHSHTGIWYVRNAFGETATGVFVTLLELAREVLSDEVSFPKVEE